MHRLPVETGRYKIFFTVIEFVNIDLNENGNEQHYLMSCRNTMSRSLRNNFIDNLFKVDKSLMVFDPQDLFHYFVGTKDKNI